MSDKIARVFKDSGATRTVALDISKTFDRVWHAGLLHKLRPYGISGQIFGLISSFLSTMRLRVVDGKSSQEYPVNAGVLEVKGTFLVLHFSYYTLMTFLMLYVLLLSMLMILRSTLNVISLLEKLSWFRLIGLVRLVPLMRKWMGLCLRKNHLLRCWG